MILEVLRQVKICTSAKAYFIMNENLNYITV